MLQVHYINVVDIDKVGDSSGVFLYYTKEKPSRLAGVLSMHVDTNVPSMARSFQDVACRIEENKVRIHTDTKIRLLMHKSQELL